MTELRSDEMEGEILLISNWDEWYGPLYTCPFCGGEEIWDDFKFCPKCGKNLREFLFEDVTAYEKRERLKLGK